MKIGVLITNYQSWALTMKTLAETVNSCGSDLSRIVVVDDASDAPAIPALPSRAVVLRNPSNLGYARSVNRGMRAMEDELVLLLDCDAYPRMNLVPRLVRHFGANARLGALGFSVVGADGQSRLGGEPEPTLLEFIVGQRVGAWLTKGGFKGARPWVVHSCCMAIRRIAFEQAGGFDVHFDFLDADIDFSMRLREAGWQVDLDQRLRCFHRGAGSPQTRSHRVLRFHRNRWLLLRAHRCIRRPASCRLLLRMRHLGELLALSTMKCLRPGSGDLENAVATRRLLLRHVGRDYEGMTERRVDL